VTREYNWILPKETGFTVREITGEADFSHYGIIHTTWGIVKLLIPRDVDKDITVQLALFGESKCEVIFKPPRPKDPLKLVELIEERLTKTLIRFNTEQLESYKQRGLRVH
jgi:hypothetical protein